MFEKNDKQTDSNDSSIKTSDSLKNTFASKKRGAPSKAEKEEKAKAAKSAEQIDKLFNSEICSDLAAIPFDLAVIATGSEHFKLNDKEKKGLGVPFEITIKAFELTKDPKYFALSILIMQYGKLFATKGLAWKLEKDAMKQKENQSQKKTDKEN